MIGTSTQYDKLETVIVGEELQFSKRMLDISMKLFYKSNLGQSIYEKPMNSYKINYDIIQERIYDLNNLSNTLTSLGIKVLRPKTIKKMHSIVTPTFKSEASSASNVRDLTLILNKTIVETPMFIRNRFFENTQMLDIFKKLFYNTPNSRLIKAPNNILTLDSMDLDNWDTKRDFFNMDKLLKYDMAIDAAQFIKINESECFVNISTYNHQLGFLWIKSLFPDITFYPLYQLIDNHLDGAFNILKDGVFLVNPKYQNLKDILPDKFKNWKYIYPKETIRKYSRNNMDIDSIFASERGMDINILSISPTDIIVSDTAIETIKCLEQNNFTPIPIQFRHSEIFAGGIHCSTLDIKRKK